MVKLTNQLKLDDDRVADFNYEGELDALIESEATLSEEFKAKTAVIFEAAVKALNVAEEIDKLEENYATELSEEVEAITKLRWSTKLIATSTMWLSNGWITIKLLFRSVYVLRSQKTSWTS